MTQSSQVWTDMSEEVGLGSGALAQGGQPETQRYLISSKWWEKWRDFSNFNTDFLQNSAENY